MSASAAPIGLSDSQILTPCVEIWRDGSLIEVSGVAPNPKFGIQRDEGEGGERRACESFSWKSRREMRRMLAKLRRDARPVFCTLTVPEGLHATPAAAKEWLRVFMQRLCRNWEGASCMWKMEPQSNGSPHFHLFIWGVAFLPWQRVAVAWSETMLGIKVPSLPALARGKVEIDGEWKDRGRIVFDAWVEAMFGIGVVDSDGAAMLRACSRVEAIKSSRGVESYASKYLTKVESDEHGQASLWEKPGRFWGVANRAALPVAASLRIEVSQRAAGRVARVMRRWLESRMLRKLRHARRISVEDKVQWLRVIAWAEDQPIPTLREMLDAAPCPG